MNARFIVSTLLEMSADFVAWAAVKLNGKIYQDLCHYDCYQQAASAIGCSWEALYGKGEEGFVTSSGRFLDREQAYLLAVDGGQRKDAGGTKRPGDEAWLDSDEMQDDRRFGQQESLTEALRWKKYDELNKAQQAAVYEYMVTSGGVGDGEYADHVRARLYATQWVQPSSLLRVLKQWHASAEVPYSFDPYKSYYKDDEKRVRTIDKLQLKSGEVWPYIVGDGVSFKEWAADEMNHGDGWHRMLLAIRKRRPVEFMFIKQIARQQESLDDAADDPVANLRRFVDDIVPERPTEAGIEQALTRRGFRLVDFEKDDGIPDAKAWFGDYKEWRYWDTDGKEQYKLVPMGSHWQLTDIGNGSSSTPFTASLKWCLRQFDKEQRRSTQ